MSSRALRKVQRERDEQERLKSLRHGDESDESEGGLSVQPAKKSAFAMLEEEDEEHENDPEDDEEEEEDGGVGVQEEPTTISTPKTVPKPKKKKKRKGKSGGGEATQTTQDSEKGLDDIDRALKELSTDGGSSQNATTAAGVRQRTDEVSKLLAIDTGNLNAQNEMRRLFGRTALEQDREEQHIQNANVGGNRRQNRRAQQVGLAQALRGHGGQAGGLGGFAATALKRNIFIQGKEEWPVATGGGLGMEIEEKRADGTILYRFVHNKVYQDVQAQFNLAVESMDPNRLVVLLQHNPFHISSLLQVSEILKQQRDHTTSGDLLERALFSFGRAVHSTFAKALGEGKARLDFRRMENREFWLAAWRYMQNLSMRATWRTVYEWAKLLLSLSPDDDPYALWLVLDQYALRARQDLDFLNISRNPSFKEMHRDMPNVQLSQGLAEFRAGNPSKGRQAIYTAVGRFPWVVARLMQELEVDPPPAIWGKEPRTDEEKLHTELYATRGKDSWNTPEATALLLEVASALPPESVPPEVGTRDIMVNEARHVLLSDTPALIALIPRRFTTGLRSSSDPLPPDDSYPSYLADMPRTTRYASPHSNSANEIVGELQGILDFFSSLFPGHPPNEDGGDNPDVAQPTIDEVDRLIRQSGVNEELIRERTSRMMELQWQLRQGYGDGNLDIGTAEPDTPDAPNQLPEREDGDMRARVEDAPDEGDRPE